MKIDFWRWSLITLLLLSSPFIYTEIQTYITINAVFPVIRAVSAKSAIALSTIFIAFNAINAILTSSITALPSSYLARKQANIIAIILIVTTQIIPIYAFFQEPEIKVFNILILLGQLIAFVFFVLIFVKIGCRIAENKQDKANV